MAQSGFRVILSPSRQDSLGYASVSIRSPKSDEVLCDLHLPHLAPTDRLKKAFSDNLFDCHAFSHRYRLELARHPEEGERLRLLAHDVGIALVSQDVSEKCTAEAVLREHLISLECEARWNNGLMIGGYLYPLRSQIIQRGGLWLPRHKVWLMPDQESWKIIHSMLPVDF